MSPSLPRRSAYRVELFDDETLLTPGAIDSAVRELESIFNQNNFERIIADLHTTHPNALTVELVFSAISETTPLTDWVIERFPTSPDTFNTSLAKKLLSKFSLSFLFPPFSPLDSQIPELVAFRQNIMNGLEIFESLFAISFAGDSSQVMEEGDESWDTYPAKKKPRGQRKNKQTNRNLPTALKPETFSRLGLSVPNTPQDAEEIALVILRQQKYILEYYLGILRLSEIAEAIKQSYTSRYISNDPKVDAETKSEAVVERPSVEATSVYPMVQPMKAALYFPNAEGFGDWQILIGSRADRFLRQTRHGDRNTFKIILKKIKELSKGHFSPDNQKRLNGPKTEIPIYEAKMTRDLRLVYQVDCVPVEDDESKLERQVLRIFGVYTHAKLDGRLWDSVGNQLGRKGKEYRRRCIFRTQPCHPGDNVFMPAVFPMPAESEQPLSYSVPELPVNDLQEVHSLLVLEKFITLSQGVLDSMIADLEITHPFHVSPQEKAIIEHPYSSYVLGRSGTGKTTTMLFKMLLIERSYELSRDSVSKPRQIFVTQSRVLAGKVEEYFLKILESLSMTSKSLNDMAKLVKMKKPQQDDDGLVDQDDVLDWHSDLPDKFSLLDDRHFPLFITFDKLCQLLEADIYQRKSIARTAKLDASQATTPSASRKLQASASYDTFLQFYWPHFAQSVTKGLDPSLVFSELMGVIKGAEETLISAERFLDRDTYEKLSPRTHPTFATQRNMIYTIFEMYLAQKRDRGDVDAADRTHDILKALETQGMPGQRIDYLYVDEVQDNLLIDAFLLRWLCRNPDGLFWAGDTAQTISVGSSFRFNDLKAFLFRIEQKRHEMNAIVHPFHRKQEPPQTFQLALNYRSHAGIVNCAHSIIDLITTFWPYAIDSLAPEQGIVDGLKPMFFSGWDTDTVRYEQFLFGDVGSHIEFGAQQCILVRDDAARERLQEHVGDIGLIMTLYESKGLEFNDVLLYNFFADSTVEQSKWRIVLHTAKEGHPIDERRYASVCSELKFLYVAITRARKNMWIADCSTKGEPMRIFWTKKNQVQTCSPGAEVPRLAVSSTAEEWASKGKELFERKKYLQARHCYERASQPRKVASANAYYLREQARKTPMASSSQRQSAFHIAAKAFRDCAVSETLSNNRTYFRIAGDCFEHAADDRQAAQAYFDAEEFGDAAKLYRKARMFDEAVEVVKMHRDQMSPAIADSITEVARLFYIAERKIRQASELFSSHDELFEYLGDRDLNIFHANILQDLGRLADAAELHLAEGRTSDAIRLFLKDKDNEGSMRRGNKCILQGLWANLSFGMLPDKTNTAIRELLDHSVQLDTSMLESSDRDEISMFKAIMSDSSTELRQLGDAFFCANNIPAALLCLDHHFTRPPQTHAMSGPEVAEILRVFLIYARLLRDMAFERDPCRSTTIQKLFGFRLQTDNAILIPEKTFLRLSVDGCRPTFLRSTDEGVFVTASECSRLFRQSLSNRLLHKVHEENLVCRDTRTFSPCLTFAVFGNCNRVECPQEHCTLSDLGPESYNIRVRIHLQQILIFQSLHSMVDADEMAWQQRYWLSRLYDALNPPFYLLGTTASLNLAHIPEAHKGLQVVKEWIRSLVYKLTPQSQKTSFLTTLMKVASLSFTLDKENASHYIYRGRCMTALDIIPPEYFRADNNYVVRELLDSYEGSQRWCITGGVLFFRHVIEKRLPVNVGVLCDLIDYLCGLFVFYCRTRHKTFLHGATLPRSWLLQLAKIEVGDRKDDHLAWLLVQPMSELLEQMYSGTNGEYLLFGGRNLANLGVMVRNVFIARICRSLSLLGYNIGNFKLRMNIGKALTSLRKGDRMFSRLYARYVYAEDWDGLARVVRNSSSQSQADALIRVFHMSGPLRQWIGVQHVTYNTYQELTKLLLDPAPATVSPTPDGPTNLFTREGHFDHENAAMALSEAVGTIDGDEQLHDDVGDADGLEEVSHGTDPDPPLDSTDIPQMMALVTASAEEQGAASRIQRAYRRVLLRRRGAAKTGLPEARSRFFAAYYKQSMEIEWPNRHYRQLFLGPLPHIFLCLDAVEICSFERKKKAKEGLQDVEHLQLDQLHHELTEIVTILKQVKRLRRALGPESDVHRSRDLEKLKGFVVEAVDLVHGLSFSTPENLRNDADLAFKGIIATKKSKRAKPRPFACLDEFM